MSFFMIIKKFITDVTGKCWKIVIEICHKILKKHVFLHAKVITIYLVHDIFSYVHYETLRKEVYELNVLDEFSLVLLVETPLYSYHPLP